jgi:hypothetical protein
MNAPHSPSPLASVQMAPKDPILGITEMYVADKNPSKVNLGVGVYYDENGKVPLLQCVRRAEEQRVQAAAPHPYLPIDGLQSYDQAVQTLVFGADSPALKEKRVVTVQALGGTGGLKIGADFLKQLLPDSQVWISDPSWENHRALFEGAGFEVGAYPYYDPATHGVAFDAMLAALNAAGAADRLDGGDPSLAARRRIGTEDERLGRRVVGGDAVDRQVAARLARFHQRFLGGADAAQQRQLPVLVVVDADAEVDLGRVGIGGELLVQAEDRVAGRHFDGVEERRHAGVLVGACWKTCRRRHLPTFPLRSRPAGRPASLRYADGFASTRTNRPFYPP